MNIRLMMMLIYVKCKSKGYYLLAEPCNSVMQLNWLYSCGLCQLIPLKLIPNTAQGCNHQSTCMPQLQLLCSAALVPNVLPRRDVKARVSSVQWSKPHSILAPTQDSNPGGRIQNHQRWLLHNHCTTTCITDKTTTITVFIQNQNSRGK